jgi:hypothetical protein
MILSTDFIHIRIFAKNEKSPASQRRKAFHAQIEIQYLPAPDQRFGRFFPL